MFVGRGFFDFFLNGVWFLEKFAILKEYHHFVKISCQCIYRALWYLIHFLVKPLGQSSIFSLVSLPKIRNCIISDLIFGGLDSLVHYKLTG